MKNLSIKHAGLVLFFILAFAMTNQTYAAYPGKHKDTKEFSAAKNNGDNTVAVQESKSASKVDDSLVLLVILAILLPPLAVYLKYDSVGTPFWWNIVFTLLFWIPGVIHALWHVLK
jgi:uncharacterized membrane protein YqaE (UPF0057 family)